MSPSSVTEKRQTTEHEEFHDDELPEEDDHSTGSRERIEQTVSSCIVKITEKRSCRLFWFPFKLNKVYVV